MEIHENHATNTLSFQTNSRTFYDDEHTGMPWIIIWHPTFEKVHSAWFGYHADENDRRVCPDEYYKGRENIQKLAHGELLTLDEAQTFIRFAMEVCDDMEVIGFGWFFLATLIHLLMQHGLLLQGSRQSAYRRYAYALHKSLNTPETYPAYDIAVSLDFSDVLT